MQRFQVFADVCRCAMLLFAKLVALPHSDDVMLTNASVPQLCRSLSLGS